MKAKVINENCVKIKRKRKLSRESETKMKALFHKKDIKKG
jgi:hypothetical protein